MTKPTETDHEPGNGKLLAGRYALQRPLGAGGMGRVWLAFDQMLECEVAVKEVMLPLTSTEAERAERCARARREARHAALLRDNPHVITVLDVVEADERPWIVMEYVPSRSLAEVVAARGPLPVPEVARIARALLDGLQAGHRRNILHRDVKPANVLLADDGRIVLTDFGISVREQDVALTVSGSVIGSPGFLAPERAHGQDASKASDVFSVGATVYYAVEGRSPFERGTAAATLTALLFEGPPNPQHAGALAPLILALLAADPRRRPGTEEAWRTLAALDSGPATTATTGTTQEGHHHTDDPVPGTMSLPGFPRTTPMPAGMMPTATQPPLPPPTGPSTGRRRRPLLVVLGVAVLLMAGAGSFALVHAQGTQGTPVAASVTSGATASGSPLPTRRTSAPAQTNSVKPSGQAAANPAGNADPATVVLAYYAAIDTRDYSRAWALGGANLSRGQPYDQWVAGYADTTHDIVTVLGVHAGVVTVNLTAVHTDGSQHFFTGTLTVTQGTITSGAMRQGTSSAPGTAAVPVLYACDGTTVVRPTSYTLMCGDGGMTLVNATWTSWSSTSAEANGTVMEKTCTPDCADGDTSYVPVTIEAFNVVGQSPRYYREIFLTNEDNGEKAAFAVDPDGPVLLDD